MYVKGEKRMFKAEFRAAEVDPRFKKNDDCGLKNVSPIIFKIELAHLNYFFL